MNHDYVLIAEDNVMFRSLLAEVLADEGFHTRTACDGVEALEHCERQLPQLLITDLQMPRLGGAELVAELEARGLGTFPVIVLSGQSDLRTKAPAGVALIEAKPCDFDRLMHKVRMLVPSGSGLAQAHSPDTPEPLVGV